MLESDFQRQLIRDLNFLFPGAIILKNDPTYIQGIPDLLILYKDRWGALECKASLKSRAQPNQEYYVSKLNSMSYAAFICPENRKEILDELRRALLT